VFDSIRDPFVILDDDYRIVKVNEAYAQIKGKEVDNLTGETCHRVLNGREEVCENCVVAATFRSKDPCVKEKRSTLQDGTEIWLEIFTYPILDDDKNVTYVIEYTRDISDRKRSEEEKKNLINELEQLSRTDGLTDLLNRRALIDILDYDFNRAARYKSDLSLMICDIDYLKTMNDTYGHLAGDVAIKTVSETLGSMLRASDILGRYGGDEFLIILPETTLAGAEELAERIRKKTEETDVQVSDDTVIRLTLSIGISDNSNADNADELISIADEALYISKRTGRNRIYADNS
jgi:diguanylate cyclase (GGDEF)-like protein/PAS domain S-box-containing protein